MPDINEKEIFTLCWNVLILYRYNYKLNCEAIGSLVLNVISPVHTASRWSPPPPTKSLSPHSIVDIPPTSVGWGEQWVVFSD